MGRRKVFQSVFAGLVLSWLLPGMIFAQDKPLVIAFEGDAATLDPHGRNETTTTTIQRHVFDQLVSFDENLKIQPDLAESWKLIDDVTWEFKLRKGIFFHNGEPFNAEPDKCDELRWCDVDALPVNIIPYVKQAIQNFRNGVVFDEFGWE